MTEKQPLSTEEEGQGAKTEAERVEEIVTNEASTTPLVNEEVKEVKTPKSSTKRARTLATPRKSSGNGSSSASSSPSKKTKGASGGGGGGGGSNSWTSHEKWTVLEEVIQTAHPNWEAIATQLGKTRSQVYDQWRKSLYPELRAKYSKGFS